MIFVTVGNHYQGFDRLIRKMDDIASKFEEEVIIQTGYTEYKPIYAKYFNFIDDFNEIKKLNRDARVVVSHAGIGTILTALEAGTPIIVVPRLKKYREHSDDHQLEIAKILKDKNNVKVVDDVNELDKCLKQEFKRANNKLNPQNELSISIKNYIRSIDKNNVNILASVE